MPKETALCRSWPFAAKLMMMIFEYTSYQDVANLLLANLMLLWDFGCIFRRRVPFTKFDCECIPLE
jgi:hypothetical protein